MNIDSAIESFFAWFYKKFDDRCGAFSNVQIFYLGEELDVDKAVSLLGEDLTSELALQIPYPFEHQALFMTPAPIKESPEKHYDGLSLDVLESLRRKSVLPLWHVTIASRNQEDVRAINVARFNYFPTVGWTNPYTGGGLVLPDGRMAMMTAKEDPAAYGPTVQAGLETRSRIVINTAYHLALIAHPSNYIVRETPTLTPKEQRRVATGKNFPDAKRPRYLIVDHEVLVNRMKPQGTHAAPAPHQRRGHWRRLAERCKYARARGNWKTWVRDCKVGETDFVANNRRYQVLMDFHDRYGTVTV